MNLENLTVFFNLLASKRGLKNSKYTLSPERLIFKYATDDGSDFKFVKNYCEPLWFCVFVNLRKSGEMIFHLNLNQDPFVTVPYDNSVYSSRVLSTNASDTDDCATKCLRLIGCNHYIFKPRIISSLRKSGGNCELVGSSQNTSNAPNKYGCSLFATCYNLIACKTHGFKKISCYSTAKFSIKI